MPDDLLTTVKAALAKAQPCQKCGGDGEIVVYGSHAEHDPGCDGSCRNCPVEVQDCTPGPCDCVMSQASISEHEHWELLGWLRALLARCEAAEAERDHYRQDYEHHLCHPAHTTDSSDGGVCVHCGRTLHALPTRREL